MVIIINKLKNLYERSEVSKGQFLSILVVVTLLFISGGSLFTTLFARTQMNFVFSYFEGDMGVVAETQMRSQEFPGYMHNQAEFAINNAALVLGENGSYADWNKTHMPSRDYLMHRFNETIVAHSQYGLRSNDYYLGCSKTPNVDYYDIEESTFGGDWVFEYSVDEKIVACGGSRWETKAFQEVEMNSIRGPDVDDDQEIPHNYIELSRYARNLTMAIREEMTQTQTWGTDSGTTSNCDPTSDQRESKRESVHKDARQNAVDNIQGVVEGAVDRTDKSDYIDVESDESSSWWPREDNPNNATEVECDLTHSHLNTTCDNEDCTGDHDHSDSDSFGDTYQDPSWDCTGYVPPGDTCVSHTHDHESDPDVLVQIDYDYNVSLAKYEAEIDMTDNEEPVITHDGETNIPFNFQYNHTINAGWPY